MHAQPLTISILYGDRPKSSDCRRVIQEVPDLQLLQEASGPENFLGLHPDQAPDVVLIDLDGWSQVPDWLEPVSKRAPKSEIIVCSQCRDSEFLLRLLQLHVQFIPLPLTKESLEAAVVRARQDRRDKAAEAQPSHVVAVAGSREGVGITSLATNLALALSEQILGKIILVDLARPFPAVSQFLDLNETHNIIDLIQSANNLDPVFIEKITQHFKPNLSILL